MDRARHVVEDVQISDRFGKMGIDREILRSMRDRIPTSRATRSSAGSRWPRHHHGCGDCHLGLATPAAVLLTSVDRGGGIDQVHRLAVRGCRADIRDDPLAETDLGTPDRVDFALASNPMGTSRYSEGTRYGYAKAVWRRYLPARREMAGLFQTVIFVQA